MHRIMGKMQGGAAAMCEGQGKARDFLQVNGIIRVNQDPEEIKSQILKIKSLKS